MTLSWDDLEQIRGKRSWHIPIPPTCPHCAYNLTGLTHNRCPECGLVFNWQVVRRRAGRIWSAVNTLRHATRDAKTGLKIAGFGWAVVLPIVLLGGGWASCFLRILGMIAGVLAVVLGSQSLNIRRVPGWARVYIEGEPPSVALGLTVVFLGLSLFVVSLVVWLG